MDESCSSVAVIQRSVVGVITDIPAVFRAKQNQKPELKNSTL